MLVGPSTEEGPMARRVRNAVLRLGSERLLMGGAAARPAPLSSKQNFALTPTRNINLRVSQDRGKARLLP